jgi:LAO/AO transport system kinase
MPSATLSQPPSSQWAHLIAAGDRVTLAKAITLVESARPEDRLRAAALLKALPAPHHDTLRIGITGPPGVGKSSFINAWGRSLAAQGHRVAVLAVDPTSRITSGSILGDKTRMEGLTEDTGVFIRPSPSGTAGSSITSRTREVIRLCEAAGFDRVLVETVGVGQSEVAVRDVTDFVMLLVQPGSGDELQGIKRGIIELADGLVITKADGDNRRDADKALADFTMALRMLPASSAWKPRVLACSAVESRGFEGVTQMITDWQTQASGDSVLAERRAAQDLMWMKQRFRERIEHFAESHPEFARQQDRLAQEVRAGNLSPIEAADQLWERVRPSR